MGPVLQPVNYWRILWIRNWAIWDVLVVNLWAHPILGKQMSIMGPLKCGTPYHLYVPSNYSTIYESKLWLPAISQEWYCIPVSILKTEQWKLWLHIYRFWCTWEIKLCSSIPKNQKMFKQLPLFNFGDFAILNNCAE